MIYSKDLLQIRKKTSLVVLGYIMIIFSIWYLPVKWLEKEPVSIIDWCFAAIFLLNGIVHLLHGLGINEERFYGKAYLTINDVGVRIKPRVFAKEQGVDWNEVSSIHIWERDLNFILDNMDVKQMNLSMLDADTWQEVKAVVKAISDNKGIPSRLQE